MRYLTTRTEIRDDGYLTAPTFDGVFSDYDAAVRRINQDVEKALRKFDTMEKRCWNTVAASGNGPGLIRWDIINLNDDLGFEESYTSDDTTGRGVPSHVYHVVTEGGRERWLDVSDEDDWGNIRRYVAQVGKNTIASAIGFVDRYEKTNRIVRVVDTTGDGVWDGDDEVLDWYNERVKVYGDNYEG